MGYGVPTVPYDDKLKQELERENKITLQSK